MRGAKTKEKYSVAVNYDGFVSDVSVGDTVLVDNGLIKHGKKGRDVSPKRPTKLLLPTEEKSDGFEESFYR